MSNLNTSVRYVNDSNKILNSSILKQWGNGLGLESCDSAAISVYFYLCKVFDFLSCDNQDGSARMT